MVVTNASFGVDFGDPNDFPLWCGIYDSLGQEGVLNVAATANLNINVDTQGDIPTTCPSDYLVAVTNTTDQDQKYPDAGYGQTHIDLGAPGTEILSTVTTAGGSYDFLTGTSMATPHVTGAVALMFAAAPASLMQQYKSNPANVALTFKNALLNHVDPISALQGKTIRAYFCGLSSGCFNAGAGADLAERTT